MKYFPITWILIGLCLYRWTFRGQGINEITCLHGHFMTPSLCFPWFLSPSFSHGLPLLGGEGRGERKARFCCRLSLAPPTTVEALHTAAAPALSNGASATELHSNKRAVSPQWSCHWADQLSGTTPRADRDPTDRN